MASRRADQPQSVGNQRGRGGSRGGGRGGGRGGRGGSNGPSIPDMSRLSLVPSSPARLAADGSSLEMARPEAAPRGSPIPGNPVDTKSFDKLIQGLHGAKLQAEFPLREACRSPNTMVYTNHFAIKLDPKIPLFQYEIKGLPDNMGRKTTKILVQAMIERIPFLKEHRDEYATDFLASIISWVELPKEALQSVFVSLSEKFDTVELSLQEMGQVDTTLLQQYAEGKAEPNKDVNDKIKMINSTLNMVISKVLSRDSFSLRANKFWLTGGHTRLSDSFCTMRGYFYSVRPAMGQILLNLNACTSAFYQPILVSAFLLDNDSFRAQDERSSALRGLRVHLTYEPKHDDDDSRSFSATIKASIKTIGGYSNNSCSRQTFRSGGYPSEEVTVQDHFRRTYNITLQHPNLPAINCGTERKPLWYPPEVLQILPYQIYKRKVPDNLTKSMLDVACNHPRDTRALIEHEGLRTLGLRSSRGFVPFSACPTIQIDARMLQIPATTLSYPTLNYGNGIVDWSNGKDAKDAKWNLNRRKFLRSSPQASFRVFVIIVPYAEDNRTKLHPANVDKVWNDFQKAAQQTYATGQFTFVGQTVCRPFAQPNIAPQVMNMAKSKGANFVILLLEKKSVPAYSIFKHLADCTVGLHSLCAIYKEDKSGNPFGYQYWGNVMMKVNLKAGGTNHTAPKIAEIMKDTLVLGADITHPGPGSLLGTPSIAAIVGSVDQYGGKFLGSMRLQPKHKACEDIKDVEGMVFERIKAWFAVNKALPKNILYYRDGVGDSQYTQVKQNELPQIRKAFDRAAKDIKFKNVPGFKLTAIVVGKRHHVLFFPQSEGTKDAMPRNGNCKPGTLVDSAVTSPYFQCFYLQSHDGLKGTAKSSHYFVLENEMGKTENVLQEFTHQLCYTYVRATMSVSYAPPAYYADRLCERGRCYLRAYLAPSPNFYNGHKQMRNEIETKLRTSREDEFKSLRTSNKSGKSVIKSAAERKQEAKDKETAEEEVKRRTFERAQRDFYGDKPIGTNPWMDSIGGTMFWM